MKATLETGLVSKAFAGQRHCEPVLHCALQRGSPGKALPEFKLGSHSPEPEILVPKSLNPKP